MADAVTSIATVQTSQGNVPQQGGSNVAPAVENARAPAAQDPRDAIFAKKEAQLNRMRQELKSQEAAMAAKYAKYDTDYIPKSRLAEDPMGVLNENGHDYNKLTELLLNQPNQNDPTVRMLRAEIKAIAEKQAAQERQAQEAQGQQFEQAKKQIDTEARQLIDADPEFESIKAQGMQEAVTQYIIDKFNESGVLMDVRDAAVEVENALVEEGLKYAQMKKVMAKMQPSPAPAAVPVGTPRQQPPTVTLKTLTNSVASQGSKRSAEKERIARAMAAFHGTLK